MVVKPLSEDEIEKIKEITPNIIGEKVRFLRKSKGLTQTELAELVLKDRQYLYKIEKGLVTPNISTIAILAKAMKIPVKKIFEDLD